MNFRPRYFVLQELVPPSIFKRLGGEAWDLFDENALKALDKLREACGPIVVNNWSAGGQYSESGLREQGTATGAPKSAHKQGKAFDCKPKKLTVKELYDYVLAHQAEFPLIRRVENIKATPTWFHFDTVDHPGTGIKVFMP